MGELVSAVLDSTDSIEGSTHDSRECGKATYIACTNLHTPWYIVYHMAWGKPHSWVSRYIILSHIQTPGSFWFRALFDQLSRVTWNGKLIGASYMLPCHADVGQIQEGTELWLSRPLQGQQKNWWPPRCVFIFRSSGHSWGQHLLTFNLTCHKFWHSSWILMKPYTVIARGTLNMCTNFQVIRSNVKVIWKKL